MMFRGRALLLLGVILLQVMFATRAQQDVAPPPEVEVLSALLDPSLTEGGGGSIFGNQPDNFPDPPERPPPTPSPDVNATAADGGGRRRLTTLKKKINQAVRARRALASIKAKAISLSDSTKTTTATIATAKSSGSSARRTLLQKAKDAETSMFSIANIIKKLKHEEQEGYKPRLSGASLAI